MRKKDDEKQKNIKEAVIKLILEEGFHGTSMSKIAKEAGVSPATVYIYYDNKEVMLQNIYREYSEEIFQYILGKLSPCMKGEEIIEILVSSYYNYILENEEIFHFVDQFSNCPALACQCGEMTGIYKLSKFLDELKTRGIIKDVRNENLMAIIFFPVKAISNSNRVSKQNDELLKEMVQILQAALLVE